MILTKYTLLLMTALTLSSINAMEVDADINIKAQNLFRRAIQKDDWSMVKVLIDRQDVRVDVQDRVTKQTPLDFAVEHGSAVIVEELLRKGAQVNRVCGSEGGSLLHCAVRRLLHCGGNDKCAMRDQVRQRMQLIDVLLLHGAKIFMAKEIGSIFHMCAQYYKDDTAGCFRGVHKVTPCGKALFQQLVCSVCKCQGSLLDTVLAKDADKKKQAQENLRATLQKIQGIMQLNNGKYGWGTTVPGLFCEKKSGCDDQVHEYSCAARVTVLDETFIKKMEEYILGPE